MSSLPLQNPALRTFWETQARYRVLYGGRASSKSWDAGIQAIKLVRLMKLKILCTRQFQSSIKESVYTLLTDTIFRMGIQDEFTILHNTIRHNGTGSEFVFFGLARNIHEVKSLENISICWIEEAGLITKEQWDILMPTIRAEGSQIWIIFNPGSRSDFVFQRFIEHPHEDSVVRKINYDENPYLSQTMKKTIAEAEQEDLEEYKHVYLGVPREGDERALFAYDEIEEAMNEDLDGVDKTGIFSYGVDCGRYGQDSSVVTKRRGYHIYGLEAYKGYNTMELANKVSETYHREDDKKPIAIFVDGIGLGSGVVDRLEEKGHRVIDANVSMKADEVDVYQNKRAESYFKLRAFIRRGGKIPKDDELKEELLAIRYFYSKTNGKIQIEAKDDMKEILGRSPDKADSVMLHFFSEVRIEQNNMMEIQKRMFRRRI